MLELYVCGYPLLCVAVIPIAPVIVTPPMEQNVPYENQATFECLATGMPDPTYSWYKNGVIISDQDLPTLYFASVQVSDRGLYSCTVTNSEGTAQSEPVYLRITGTIILAWVYAPYFESYITCIIVMP